MKENNAREREKERNETGIDFENTEKERKEMREEEKEKKKENQEKPGKEKEEEKISKLNFCFYLIVMPLETTKNS